MKIALLGYGRMGQAIEKIAESRGHQVVLRITEHDQPGSYDLTQADIAIDFSIPNAAVDNISNCFNVGIPVVSGTTGWLSDYDKIVALCGQKQGGFIYASNFSLGVNLFFELNQQLAKLMKPIEGYDIAMEEIHHKKKLDAPSGTAITLAECVLEHSNSKDKWELDRASDSLGIPIVAKRIKNVPGTHSVTYTSDIDTIEITHTAHNRQGFALGAVVASEWLVGKKGVFSMKDVLGLS